MINANSSATSTSDQPNGCAWTSCLGNLVKHEIVFSQARHKKRAISTMKKQLIHLITPQAESACPHNQAGGLFSWLRACFHGQLPQVKYSKIIHVWCEMYLRPLYGFSMLLFFSKDFKRCFWGETDNGFYILQSSNLHWINFGQPQPSYSSKAIIPWYDE